MYSALGLEASTVNASLETGHNVRSPVLASPGGTSFDGDV